MLQAAEQGKPASPAGLGIDPTLLQRVMEAAGGKANASCSAMRLAQVAELCKAL